MSTPADQVAVATAPAVVDPNNPNEERAAIAKREWDEFAAAQAFDVNARRQYERDRRYAAGTADVTWAVNANLLGSYIDILVSYIYARNPKVSVRPSEQCQIVYEPPLDPTDSMGAIQRYQDQETRRKYSTEQQAFAKTLQIVITRLWKEGKLKPAMKKVVRAGFSVAIGWFKAVLLFDTKTDPQVQNQVNDIRDNLARIEKLKADLIDDGTGAERPREVLITELKEQQQGLEAKIEIILRKAFAIDFVSSEHMQVALDIHDVDDYLEAGWVANIVYRPLEQARTDFPDVTEEEWKTATTYTQREPTNYAALTSIDGEPALMAMDPRGEAHQYVSSGTAGSYTGTTMPGGQEPLKFVKVVEKWDQRVSLIKTMVEGLKRLPKEPFAPRFGTSRFYPYFQVEFFPVDGDRHAQSMSWRLSKLQDEYAASRSSFRQTRQRSVPGVIFNASQIGRDMAKKLQDGTESEYIAIELTDPTRPVGDSFAAKPIPKIDPGLFDNSLIIGDMEKLSGVQEALQTSQTVEKTATQAEIEQGGFAARTTAQRDCVEECLSEFALYTAEIALQGFTTKEVQKMAGPLAFWPEQLPLEAVTQMLNVEIEAGSTGRPNTAAERQSWAELLPLIKETMVAVMEARAAGQEEIARCYIELLRETLTRFDDRLDVDRFIPAMPPLPQLLAAPGPGAAPGSAPGGGGKPAPIPGADPSAAAPTGAPGNTDPLAAAA